MKILRKIIAAAIVALFITVSAAACFLLELMHHAETPVGTDATMRTVVIRAGDGFSGTAGRLADAGLNPHPFKFAALARLKGYDKRVRAGEYDLSRTMTPLQILEALIRGKDKLYRITVPEGYNLKQIAAAVARAGFGSEKDFLRAAEDKDRVAGYAVDGPTLEGYLFPDTYYFPRWAGPEQIIDRMVRRFQEIFTEEWRQRARAMGLTRHQVVTLASIIEKETGAAAERPLISSVFHNRMARGMRLETDPTVIYGIPDFDGNLTRKHLATPTPYNTYKIRGLPPGPIASPGSAALSAALYPADTRFLYFVSKRDTTHQFSTNFRDHNRAVRRYQLRK
jgi:peptidoglycan lytic transglycosylase G